MAEDEVFDQSRSGADRNAIYFCDSDSGEIHLKNLNYRMQKYNNMEFNFGRLDTSTASFDNDFSTTDTLHVTSPCSPTHESTPTLPLPIAPVKQREIKKEGYLHKQGGQNQDKGWKKRYVRFDGETLRYYQNEKATASLRIVPVGIMEDVKHEEKRNSSISAPGILSGTAKSFKFSLKTFNRTYLFATDNNDNCVQWVCTLSEAIIKRNKESTPVGVKIGGTSGKPDFESSIKIGRKSKKYHAALKGDTFRYYYNKEDFEIDCPVHELYIPVTRAKKLEDEHKLQLYSAPNQVFVLTLDNQVERDQWKMYLDEGTSNNIGDNEIVNEIRQNKENRTCADCSSEKTNWASINLGIVLCIKCAGIHRGLSSNYSKVRSLRMDNIFRENNILLQMFSVIGNRNANKFWYANPPPDLELDEDTPDCIRRKQIYQKYVKKEFVSKTDLKSTDINKEFLESVRKGDTLEAMRYLEFGADINVKSEEDGLNAIEIASTEGHYVLVEYLEQNKDRQIEPPKSSSDKTLKEELLKRSSIHHDGHLEKTGPNMKGWLQRWFVLHFCRLTYFDDKKGSDKQKEKGTIDLDQIVCVAVVYCNERPYSFDLTCKENKRIYRFAAADPDLRRKWMNVILQVICPESVLDEPMPIKQYKIAGYFFVQQHSQGPWIKSWFGVGAHVIDIHYLNDSSQSEKIAINPGTLRIYKYNANRSSKMLTSITPTSQLDGNKTIELQIDQSTGDYARDRYLQKVIIRSGVLRVQGHHSEDTEKVFNILNPILST